MIGQLTDTHVVASDPSVVDAELYVDNNDRLRRAVASIVEEPVPVAAVVATGDLTNDGRPEEYDAVVELLAPISDRVLALPGNHDDPDELRRRLPTTPWADTEHASWHTVIAGVRIVGLDSTRRGPNGPEHGGAVDTDRLTWLDRVLAVPHDGLTLLAMHHPPFASGIWWMDRDGFDGADQLAEVLRDRKVDRIMCGHLHRPMSSMFAGTIAQVGMSTVHHVGPDFVPGRDVTVADDPVGYQLLRVTAADAFSHGNGGATAVLHHRYIEPFAAPIVPEWADQYR